jgi:RNA polymerase sigma-70 factor (ECF subfamily)
VALVNAIRLPHPPLLLDGAEEDLEPPAAAAADRGRLRALVEAHFDFIWRALSRMSIPSMDLSDCVQQVFLVASRKLPTIAEGRERSFLIGTALRVAADARRTHERRREVPEDESRELLCPAPQPDEIADQRRLRALLDEVLAAMPEDLRVVFILFELEEMPTQEIAALLDLPSGTVASRLRRAREEFDRRVARLRASLSARDARGGKR